MYPEAGGSSSFARRAFNEFWSFFAAWGQMLNYVVTVAISAFFVPHYLGSVFWEALRHSPGRHHRRRDHHRDPGRDQRGRGQGVGGPEHRARGRRLPHPGAAGGRRRGARARRRPGPAGRQRRRSGVAPTWKDFILAIPIGMIAYTGIETISNMAEEAQGRDQDDPGRDQARRDRRVRHLLHAARGRAGRAAGHSRAPDGEYYTLLGLPEEEGGYAGDPIAGLVANLNLGAFQTPAEIYVGILAATILFLATNAGLIGVSRLVYSMGIHRQLPDQLRQLHPRYRTPWIGIIVFGVVAIIITLPGQADVPRQPVRVRGDAVVHDRAPGADPAADLAARHPAALPAAGERELARAATSRCSPSSAGSGRAAAFVVTVALHPDVAATGVGWLDARRRRLPALPARAGARPGLDAQGRDPAAGRRSRGRVRLRARPAGGRRLRRVGGRHRGQARGPPAARDPRARAGHRAERAEDRRADARGRGGRASR